MRGVQNSRSQGCYAVRRVGIEKLILHLRYEAGSIGNHAFHKLGASLALAKLHSTNFSQKGDNAVGILH